MELRQLERFLAVVEHGSLAAAARSLGLTQQALSASLANLEKDLGVRLFDRSPGGIIRPTGCGLALVRHARAQIAGAERALDELRSISGGRVGTVTIGVGEAFAGDIIATAIGRIGKALPDLRINLFEGYSEELLRRLYDGECDFIAAGASAFQLAAGYTREVIYTANDIVVCRPAHPLARERRLDLANLVDQSWLVPYSRPADLDVITEAFVSENLPPPLRVIGSDAYRVGMQLLTNNDLLMMCSPALIAPELSQLNGGLVALPIDRPTVRRHACLIFPRERPMTPAASAVLDEVRESARSPSTVTSLAGRRAGRGR